MNYLCNGLPYVVNISHRFIYVPNIQDTAVDLRLTGVISIRCCNLLLRTLMEGQRGGIWKSIRLLNGTARMHQATVSFYRITSPV